MERDTCSELSKTRLLQENKLQQVFDDYERVTHSIPRGELGLFCVDAQEYMKIVPSVGIPPPAVPCAGT